MRTNTMRSTRKTQHDVAEEIVGRLARRHSTAVVLFHHAVAERLGLGPTDHKCLDLLRERGRDRGHQWYPDTYRAAGPKLSFSTTSHYSIPYINGGSGSVNLGADG